MHKGKPMNGFYGKNIIMIIGEDVTWGDHGKDGRNSSLTPELYFGPRTRGGRLLSAYKISASNLMHKDLNILLRRYAM
jgi:hypothetical protein